MKNVFGPSLDGDLGASNGQYYQIGRVKSIVMGPTYPDGKPNKNYKSPSDIGKISFELLYSALSTSKSEEMSEPAYPIWNFVRQLPLLNEVVFIITGPSRKLNDKATEQRYYYIPAYALWDNPNHNAFPNMEEWADYLNEFSNKPQYSGNAGPDKMLPLGFTFTENENVKDLQPFEGDTIIQARFGQSIRFGSTVTPMKKFNTWSNIPKDRKENSRDTNGDPITIIVNSQGKRRMTQSDKFLPIVEDINIDGSSIYLTSTQEINLVDINNFPLASFGVAINPILQQVVEIQRKPISDEVVSAQAQDEKTIK